MVTKLSNTVVDTMAEAQFRYMEWLTDGLEVTISEGLLNEIEDDGGPTTYPQQVLTLTDDAVNYVYLDFTDTPATLVVSTTKPDSNIMLIYQFVTASGAVDSFVDYRFKTFNNRFLQDPFWPGSEEEIVLWRHTTSAGPTGFMIIRGLDTPRQRAMTVMQLHQADDRIASDDGTFGANAYGFWKSFRSDGKYQLNTRNVNGSASIPCAVYKQNTTANSYPYIDWERLPDPPQMVDNTATPDTGQIFYVEYNPVYNEFICQYSNTDGPNVYEDNDDDTFTVLTPNNSFDTPPSGSGNRNYRGAAFSDDGEYWAHSYVGGSEINFYERSGSGDRYQLLNSITTLGNDYNGALVYWDKANSEFIVGTRTNSIEEFRGYSYNGSSGEFEEEWAEDSTTNTTWEFIASTQEDYTINGNKQEFFVTSDGQTLLVGSTTSSGSYGIHTFSRRMGGGWQHVNNDTILGDLANNFTLTDHIGDFGLIKTESGEDYVYICDNTGINLGGYGPAIYKYNGTSFSEVMRLNVAFSENDSRMWDGLSFTPEPIKVVNIGTVDDPTDSILGLYDPYWVWTPIAQIGEQTWDIGKRIQGWTNGEAGDYQWGPVYQDTGTASGSILQPGPIANTLAFEVISANNDIVVQSGEVDSQDFLADTANSIPELGMQGTWVIVWRSPSSWEAVTDSGTSIRPLVAFGQVGAFPNSQPTMAMGLGIEGAGSTARLKYGIGHDNGSGEYLVLQSGATLSTSTWYLTAFVQPGSGDGIQVYNNSVLQTMTNTALVGNWHGGALAWMSRAATTTKAMQIGSQNLSSLEIEGAYIHALAYYTDALASAEIDNLVNGYGL